MGQLLHGDALTSNHVISRESQAIVVLDIIAPILLMIGIKLGTAANASLLGNSEIVATTLITFGLCKMTREYNVSKKTAQEAGRENK
ncbi:hypothetical protein [Butyrivibrio proteoclasticus]|nr:hypothetical protein [Butyrivibrio proteoclasticus]